MYHVVLEHTDAIPEYAGFRTWHPFESEESFKEWYTEDIQKMETVIDKGISPEECKRLCAKNSNDCLESIAVARATRDNGSINISEFFKGMTDAEYARVGNQRRRIITVDSNTLVVV